MNSGKQGKSNQGGKKGKISLTTRGEKIKFIIGLSMLILSAFLLISFISYLFYGASDQSKLGIKWTKLLFNPEVKVENKGGKIGAYISEIIINKGFGIPSFLFIYILIITGFKIIGINLVKYKRSLFNSALLLVWFSIALGLIFTKTDGGSSVYAGGKYGFHMSYWLTSLIGTPGLALLLFITGLVLLITRFEMAYIYLKALLKIIFSRKKKPVAEKPKESRVEETKKQNDLLIADNTFTKVIEEDDTINAIFEPDHQEKIIPKDNFIIETAKKEELAIPEDDLDKPEVFSSENDDEEDETYGLNMPAYDPTMELSGYKFPTLDLLEEHNSGNAEVSNEELISNKNKIVETLKHYKIEITKIRATIGPTITLYEIVPAPGIRIAKIKNLEDDIALSLAALGIRIIAPIPGRGTIGIEVPNQNPEVVSMRSILSSKKFQESTAELPIAIGKTISNETFIFDMVKMPHILVAGATGQGKSVGVNVIIASLLYKLHPTQLKFVLIDPKKVELNLYSVLEKHYLAKLPNEEEPVITDIQKVKNTLNSLNIEMDLRYDLLKKAHTRNIKEYNAKFINRRLNPEKGHRYMPYIVVIIDEFADLIMTAGKEIELPIARIAQLARAVGIHMIIATQRPSTNIITGVIKANFPTRIGFKVASMIDSRTILDTPGANQLIGKGDMLISAGSSITRVQCAFIDTPEVEKLCSFISEQRGFASAFNLPEFVGDDEPGAGDVDLNNTDELFEDAARIVVLNQLGSTSMIQRKFSIGYNRAGRIMDQLEVAGVVGPSEGSKARQVLIQDEYTLEQLLNSIK